MKNEKTKVIEVKSNVVEKTIEKLSAQLKGDRANETSISKEKSIEKSKENLKGKNYFDLLKVQKINILKLSFYLEDGFYHISSDIGNFYIKDKNIYLTLPIVKDSKPLDIERYNKVMGLITQAVSSCKNLEIKNFIKSNLKLK